MATPLPTTHCWRFGLFEVDARREELRRAGVPLKVREQPFRILVFLLEHAGEIVTREQLRGALWSADVFVDFDHSLNTAMMKLREALGDTADQPLYIETIPKKGYRFVAPVTEGADGRASSGEIAAAVGVSGVDVGSPSRAVAAPVAVRTTVKVRSGRRRWIWYAAAGAVAAMGIVAAWWTWWSEPAAPYVTSIEAITHDGIIKYWLVTDGARLYFSEIVKQRQPLAQVSAAGGEVSILATPFAQNWPLDIAPDKSSLLVSDLHWSAPSPLWIVPLSGGAPRRVGNLLVDDATWTPDGSQIVFIKGREIWRANADGSQAHKLLTAPGLAYFLKVSPDGKCMRYSVQEQLGGMRALPLWEANTDGSGAHRLLPGWQEQPIQFAGSWSPDGRSYVFGAEVDRGGNVHVDLWLVPERRGWFSHRRLVPVQLTRGPLDLGPPVAFSPDGRTLFAAGGQLHGELMRFDPATHQAAPYLSGISASEEAFSPDGQWVTYITAPDGNLWLSRTDGSNRLQLTPATDSAFIPRWSPDGRRIAFEWWPGSKKGEKLAVIARDGGAPEQVIPDSEDSHEQDDPTWSPDGEQIIFARDAGRAAVERMELLRVDLRTRKVTPVPGSEGLFSPRWSRDGRYLAALSLDSRSIHLFDFQKQMWTTWFTVKEGHLGFNLWSQDSRALYFATDEGEYWAYWRIGVGDPTPMKIADLPDEALLSYYQWPILAPDGGILYTRDRSTGEIYALHLSEK